MWQDERPSHSAAACADLLDHLELPPAELLKLLAPEGWRRSRRLASP